MLGKIGAGGEGVTEDEMVNGITNSTDMLLLLLSRFSRVRLCVTP